MRKTLGILSVLILMTISVSGCGKVFDVIKDDPLGNFLLATSEGTLAVATLPVTRATPKPTQDHGPFILMLDDFSDPTSGWEISSNEYGKVDYDQGGYLVEAYIQSIYNWGVAGRQYEDVRIEVDAQVLETNDNQADGYGVECRIQDNGDGYGFRISSDGSAAIMLYVDGNETPLYDWEYHSVILTSGEKNHLTAICQGNHLSLLVNDEPIAEVVDDTFSSGDIALSAITFEEEIIKVLFDDIVVQQIGNPYLYEDVEEYSLLLQNPTSLEICAVYIVPAVSEYWGLNLLPQDVTIPPGDSYTFESLAGPLVDIKAETCAMLALLETYEYDLDLASEITVREPLPLFHEPFDEIVDWPLGVVEGGLISHKNGDYYSILVSEADRLVTANSNFAARNITIHSDASLVKTGQNEMGIYGVTCRMQKDGSGILFGVRGDGMAAILQVEDGMLIPLTDWKTSEYVYAGIQANYITGQCSDSTFTMFVNGDFMGAVEDNTFPAGKVGVAVYSPAGASTQVDFDFLDVYELDDLTK